MFSDSGCIYTQPCHLQGDYCRRNSSCQGYNTLVKYKGENKIKLVFGAPEIPLADFPSYDNEEVQRPLLSMASCRAVPRDGLLLLCSV